MAFEDDMIEAGYSDEQDYLDSLIDDFEESYRRQRDRDLECSADFEYDDYDEDEERERKEKREKRELEKQWVEKWKNKNPDLSIIWDAEYQSRSYCASLSDYSINEYYQLKKWLNEREIFEVERNSICWKTNIQKLFALYKKELFDFYFPSDMELINMALISQQAQELSSIKIHEPSLWEFVSFNYEVDPKLLDSIEEEAFWNEVYNRDMDYEFWRDNNIEQYNQIVKHWIAESAIYVYGDWLKKHEMEEAEWKNKKQDLWNRYKFNYEIRKNNEFIESKMNEYENNNTPEGEDFLLEEDLSYFAVNDFTDGDDVKQIQLLPELENHVEIPFDIDSLTCETRQIIIESLYSINKENISKESAQYADKALTQLWIYQNRDDWAIDAIKKHYDYLFKYAKKYSIELLNWWKEKYPIAWQEFQKNIAPKFQRKFEIYIKIRLWALDGHKDEFFDLGDKYLPYWKKTLIFMYGQDIHEQLSKYFYSQIGHSTDFWGDDVDYIKKCTSSKHEIEIWQKELQDKVIWKFFYEEKDTDSVFLQHLYLELMYTSLIESGDIQQKSK